ncbi:hypothetical protein E2C01_062089 [Portunus trituberculatus]|uniref:Uncharacterized protein n=1 Tax=Portunus trituberculatus TaxID=210409 RepID=A0A5B7HCN8_PORTR|nr:hypothetical protein [Portunus trituberculatus]
MIQGHLGSTGVSQPPSHSAYQPSNLQSTQLLSLPVNHSAIQLTIHQKLFLPISHSTNESTMYPFIKTVNQRSTSESYSHINSSSNSTDHRPLIPSDSVPNSWHATHFRTLSRMSCSKLASHSASQPVSEFPSCSL